MTDSERLFNEGIESSMLDDLVHEMSSRVAARTNNEGMKEQIEFLTGNGLTIEEIIEGATR